ncbi:MAG: hypothetical protein ACUVUF_03160 [Candidatus Bathycorpusculaceae bacterium]
MSRQNVGQIRILEAFLAVMIIFSAFAVSANLTVTRSNTENSDLAFVGLQALMQLDSDGSLNKLIDESDWVGLRETLSLALPAGISFNLTIYNAQMQQVNPTVISNGALTGQKTAFVEYVCVSRNPLFRCYIIHLRLAVAK